MLGHAVGRYCFRHADRIARVDDGRADLVKPRLPAVDFDLGVSILFFQKFRCVNVVASPFFIVFGIFFFSFSL